LGRGLSGSLHRIYLPMVRATRLCGLSPPLGQPPSLAEGIFEETIAAADHTGQGDDLLRRVRSNNDPAWLNPIDVTPGTAFHA
jgi:hypothetical protein